jgi:hypothetical protein
LRRSGAKVGATRSERKRTRADRYPADAYPSNQTHDRNLDRDRTSPAPEGFFFFSVFLFKMVGM